MKSLFALFALTLFASSAYADKFQFAVSNEAVEAAYTASFSENFAIRGRLLHTDVDEAKVEKQKIDTKTDAVGVGIFSNERVDIFDFQFGGEVFWIDPDFKRGPNGQFQSYGISLGANMDTYINEKFYISTGLMYAPNILTGGKLDNYLEVDLRLTFQVIKNTAIFLGYRYLDVELSNNGNKADAELYNSLLIGFKLNI